MTASFNPTGLTPTRIRGAAPNSNGTNEYPIKSGTAATIFKGAPVRVSAGNLVAIPRLSVCRRRGTEVQIIFPRWHISHRCCRICH